uniref:Secreted protein n=1 Tax=Macrostomum lignano TaxID=282301 RepID=A0A1I8FC71_9PLAT
MVWLSPALQPAGMKLTKRRVQLSKWLLPRLSESAAARGPNQLQQEQLHTDTSIKQRVLYTRVCRSAGCLEAMLATQPGSITLPTLLITAQPTASPIRLDLPFVARRTGPGQTGDWPAYLGARHSCTLRFAYGWRQAATRTLMQWFAGS